MDLEFQIASLRDELDSLTPIGRSKPNEAKTWLPSFPARDTLKSHRVGIRCIAFHPVFSSLASGSDNSTIKIWDWELGELERTLKGHTRPVSSLDFGGPKGHTLLASCSTDLSIKLWDPSENFANIRTLYGHEHSVSAVRFLQHTANLLVSASRDSTIMVWDVSTGYCIKTVHSDNDWIRDVPPSFDGKWLVYGGHNHIAKILEVSTGELKATLLGHDNDIECCIFAPPASYGYLSTLAGLKKPPPTGNSAEYVLTGGRDKPVKIWNFRGTLIKTFNGHNNWVRGLVVHPSGRYLISVGDDKTMRCWDLSQEGN
ncbi:hypothetical protein PHISCL_09206 [Aspergillus sclerotialis]|uniref:Mitochondrial division protein 1 n=1 Tax=Aspergillus sclerotialis TaxID=2070753 RepID=A0A3A2Z5T1_9EURO|nr:hypothetical protein PHISCL_09206 [Aspergillus sclerotialis]